LVSSELRRTRKLCRSVRELDQDTFDLLPHMRRVADELEAEIKHCLIPVSRRLDKYERLVVTSRVKECESALDSLRRRQEGWTFDSER
jgi:ppGpp synthetase/RelA/SpoT-type nucleotidyltranferase